MNYLKKAAVCMTAATMFTANSAGFMPYDPIGLPAITANAADVVASGECGLKGNNVTWTLDSEGTLTISGEGEMKSSLTFSAPWETESINKVVIENGVTSIGYNFFKDCKNLTSVSLPDSLITIYDCAFMGCKGLSEISIPSSVTEIGGHAFYDTLWLENKRKESPLVIVNNILIDAMTYTGDVVIPDNVVCIGNDSFFCNYNITSVIIPDSVKSIKSSAFTDCSKLSTITIPGNVESIGNLAFHNCRNLTSLTIEEGVIEINGGAFEGCASLTSLILPETLTAIGKNAFGDCTSLKKITIPHKVTLIGNQAFAGCSSLESVVIKNLKCVIESIVGKSTLSTTATIYGYEGSTAQEYAEKYNRTFVALDDEKTSAEMVASGSCGAESDNVTWKLDSEGTLTISGEGEMSNDYSFNLPPWTEYENLNKVIIEDGVTSIGFSAFYNCSNITAVSIPDSVTKICNDAFYGCRKLNSLTIPDSVTSIGRRAVDNTPWLEAMRNKNPFVIINGVLIDGLMLKGDVIIPDNVKIIGHDAFSDCTDLTSITIPNNVTSIGYSVFRNCSLLESVTLPDSITEISADAFWGCTNLKSITIPASLSTIENGLFVECSSLTTITIPKNITNIGYYTFDDCSSLKSITIENTECKIADAENTMPDTATIYGYAGSTAQAYAEKYNRTFIALDEKPAVTTSTSLTTTATTTSTTTTTATTAPTTAATTTATTAPPPDVVLGDVDNNGRLDMLDASYIMSHINLSASGQESILTADQQKTADINSDGCINSYDIYIINRVYAAIQTAANVNNISEYIAENFNYECADSKDGGYTAEEIDASPVKPTLSIVNVEYKLDELAKNGYIAEVTISADGFENVTALDFHVFYDDKLTPCYNKSNGNKYLKADTLGGADICMFSKGANEEYNSIFLSLANTNKADINGDIIKLYFNIPRDAENGDEFILYPEYTDGDMLVCGEDNKAHAYLFTKGLKYGTISIDGELVTTTTTTTTTTTSTVTTTTTTSTTTAPTTTTPPTTNEPTYNLGDVDNDGKVDSVDASLVLAEYALIQTGGELTFTQGQKNAADVNKDDVVDSSDASKIIAYYAMISTGKEPTWD